MVKNIVPGPIQPQKFRVWWTNQHPINWNGPKTFYRDCNTLILAKELAKECIEKNFFNIRITFSG